ncbi:MAG: biotin/lipoyl-binding protein, partial [Kiritimatiellia bacterium]
MIKSAVLKDVGRQLAVLSCAGLALFCGCAKKETAPPARPPSPVTVATARAADVPVMLETFGRLLSVADVDIKPQVSGRIIEAPFVEGERVAKGDVLFLIETDAYQAAVDQAEGQLAVAKADLAQAHA